MLEYFIFIRTNLHITDYDNTSFMKKKTYFTYRFKWVIHTQIYIQAFIGSDKKIKQF